MAQISRNELLSYLDEFLAVSTFNDYCPNGLQVEGKPTIKKIVTGVTATQALIDKAIAENADAILVHHGYFWKGESPVLQGMKKQRIAALLAYDVNLLAYHLPLDGHPQVGNNAQLGKLFGFENIQASEDLVFTADVKQATSLDDLTAHISKSLNRDALAIEGGGHAISKVAWCTGGAQSYIELAKQKGADVFISGEISEQTTHFARENNIHFIAAGHHATERYGVKALGEHIADKFSIECVFVDIDNPA